MFVRPILFEICLMSRSQLVESDLREVSFEHADMRYSPIECCQIGGARFRDADLEGASLHGTSDEGAGLREGEPTSGCTTDRPKLFGSHGQRP